MKKSDITYLKFCGVGIVISLLMIIIPTIMLLTGCVKKDTTNKSTTEVIKKEDNYKEVMYFSYDGKTLCNFQDVNGNYNSDSIIVYVLENGNYKEKEIEYYRRTEGIFYSIEWFYNEKENKLKQVQTYFNCVANFTEGLYNINYTLYNDQWYFLEYISEEIIIDGPEYYKFSESSVISYRYAEK